MSKFRKKPVEIEARQLQDDLRSVDAVALWVESNGGTTSQPFVPTEDHVLSIQTLEGEMRAGLGDWIIRGVQGEFYPCKPDIFDATYEPVGGSAVTSPDPREEAVAQALCTEDGSDTWELVCRLDPTQADCYRYVAGVILAAADRVDPKRTLCDVLCEHGRGCERLGLHEVHEHDDAGMGVVHAWRRGRSCWPLHYNESDDDD